MKKGSKKIKLVTHDFSTFRASNCAAKSPVRTMKKVKITKVKNVIKIQFVSKSFLKSQVRSMVGSLKYLGEKKWNLKNLSVYLNQNLEKIVLLLPLHMVYILRKLFIRFFFLFILHLDPSLTIQPQQFFEPHLQGKSLQFSSKLKP